MVEAVYIVCIMLICIIGIMMLHSLATRLYIIDYHAYIKAIVIVAVSILEIVVSIIATAIIFLRLVIIFNEIKYIALHLLR